MKPIKPIDIRSIHGELQARIKEYIVENGLRPGDPLPTEAQFAGQLHVSRSGLREALRSLESLGVIVCRRGTGHCVNGFNLDPIVDNLSYSMYFDTDEAREMLEIRERLELSFIGDAVASIDAATLDELRTVIAAMRRKADLGQVFLQEDIAFHRALYRTVSNRLLVKLLDVFWNVYDHLRDRSLLEVPDVETEALNHEQLLAAVEGRDAEAAGKLLLRHFGSMEARLNTGRTTQPAGISQLTVTRHGGAEEVTQPNHS